MVSFRVDIGYRKFGEAENDLFKMAVIMIFPSLMKVKDMSVKNLYLVYRFDKVSNMEDISFPVCLL